MFLSKLTALDDGPVALGESPDTIPQKTVSDAVDHIAERIETTIGTGSWAALETIAFAQRSGTYQGLGSHTVHGVPASAR